MPSKPTIQTLEAADRFHSAAIHALRHVRRASKGEQVLQRGRRRRVERLGGRLAKLEPSEVETIRHAAELVERALAE
jgi:pyruvate/2-oxoglutarate dehydrogenase complex dihydrolipoamide dehydrogenase (E3) component